MSDDADKHVYDTRRRKSIRRMWWGALAWTRCGCVAGVAGRRVVLVQLGVLLFVAFVPLCAIPVSIPTAHLAVSASTAQKTTMDISSIGAGVLNVTDRFNNPDSPSPLYYLEDRSSWYHKRAILFVSIFLAIFIVLILCVTVFLRDRNVSMSDAGVEAFGDGDDADWEANRHSAVLKSARNKMEHIPRKFSRGVRRRWKRHGLAKKPTVLEEDHEMPPAHRPAPGSPVPSIGATEPAIAGALVVSAHADSAPHAQGVQSDNSADARLSDTAPLHNAHTPLDQTDVDAVDVMEHTHVVQPTPPAYATQAPPLLNIAVPNTGKLDGAATFASDAPPSMDTNTSTAHVATDEKSAFDALVHAASAPASAVANALPSAPLPDAADEGDVHSTAKGKQRVESPSSLLPAPPDAPTMTFTGFDTLHASQKEQEAAEERAALGALLPSQPGGEHDAVVPPVYVPTAPTYDAAALNESAAPSAPALTEPHRTSPPLCSSVPDAQE